MVKATTHFTASLHSPLRRGFFLPAPLVLSVVNIMLTIQTVKETTNVQPLGTK